MEEQMKDYVIVTDSSCDLPREIADEWGVKTLSLEVTIDGVGTFLNHEIDPKEFYGYMRNKYMAKTAAANMDRFSALFEELVKEGKDILYIGFSSGLSATYMAGKNAAEEVMEKYPDCKILTVDSLCASLGQGLLVRYAVDKKNEGADIETLAKYVEELVPHMAHWFTVDDLAYLKRGGRVSAATAVMGTVLQIKPVMHMDDTGKLINIAKARGRDASIKAIVQKMKESTIDPETQKIHICHGDCYEDAKKLADMVTAEFGIKDILIYYTGPVIGAHSGPGTLALFFVANER
jgi:DegV family protein with EDD domain